MLKNKSNQKVVSVIILLASQFRWLLERSKGKPVHPNNDKKLAALTVELVGEDKVLFRTGESTSMAYLPVEGTESLLDNKIRFTLFESGIGKVDLMHSNTGQHHPIRREVAKTKISQKSVKSTDKSVTIREDEHVIYFRDGVEGHDHDVNFSRKIAGADWMIIYTKDRGGNVNVLEIVYNDIQHSDEAVECFQSCMTPFYREPAKAFNFLNKHAAAPAKAKKTTRVKTDQPLVNASETQIDTVEAPPTKKKAAKAAKPVTPATAKPAKAAKAKTGTRVLELKAKQPGKKLVAEKPATPKATRTGNLIFVDPETRINSPFAVLGSLGS